MRKHVTVPKYQQGIALITVILIVALATITAVAMTERQQFDIARTSNLLQNQQVFFHALGGEQWARGLLKRDADDDNKKNEIIDTLDEDWAQALPATPLENGSVSGNMEDMQARFNINNLYLGEKPVTGDIDRVNLQRPYFERLLKILEIEEPVTQAIMDWLDPDAEIQFPLGAEDPEYLSATPPYRAANRMMISPTELLLVKGINQEIYNKLEPYISTLPEFTPVNVNTAPARIIAALTTQLDLETAKDIIKDREDESYSTTSAFIEILKQHVKKIDTIKTEVLPLVSVSTDYFLVHANVQIGQNKTTLLSLINRQDDGKTKVILRSPGIY